MLEHAILQAVAYADVFDYPLSFEEVHRYLVACDAPPEATQAVLGNGRLVPKRLSRCQGYVTLPGHEAIVELRRAREQIAARLWERAVTYGHVIAQLPFVRMVAVTGALAMNNVEADADLDYLIVTALGRLWVCRALVVLLVRLAARRGDVICPNYFLSEQALNLQERNLFTAHEMTQMVPLAGMSVYERMRQMNRWTEGFLPNAIGAPRVMAARNGRRHTLQSVSEGILRTPAGEWLEQWEMNRKVHAFSQRTAAHPEAAFGRDWCKGHFDDHEHRVMAAFTERLRALEGMS